MNILVTGGAGFIGRWVVKRLLDDGNCVWVLDNLSNGHIENLNEFRDNLNLDITIGDIKNTTLLSRLFENKFDLCIHLAASIIVQDSIDHPRGTFENDVVGTFNVLEEAKKTNTKFVFMSTCMVYDTASADGAISEIHPTKATSPYAGARLAGENMVQSYYHAYGLPTVIVRPFNTYGPYQKSTGEGGVVSIFVHKDLSGEVLNIYGDGTQTRDLMYVEDCAEFVVQAAYSDAVNGEILNAGLGEDITINNLATVICKDAGRVRHVEHIHPQSEIQKLVCDYSKAKRVLGWEPRTSLPEGIGEFRNWVTDTSNLGMDFIPYGTQWIDDDDINEVVKVLRSDWITTGPKIKEFEDALCSYIGCRYSVVVNSGTSALDISVLSLDLPEGSEIITTPFTFVATSNAIIYNGLKPVFADICSDTFNIDPEDIRRKITKDTKAIIYVDYAGQPCDIEAIREIADEFDLHLIEDACHAIGAEYKRKKVGNFADLTIFSFHPVKHITTGEGGAVVTNDEELYMRLSLLRSHGIDKDAQDMYGPNASWAYDMKYLGRNYRMTDIQAALGISQLKKLDMFIDKRNKLALRYQEILRDVNAVTLPVIKSNVRHAWHLYTILLDESIDRDEFFKYMRNANIGVNLHYIPVYKHSYYVEKIDIDAEEFPVTENVFKRIITLPLFPRMSENELTYICNKIINYLR